jgi:6-phosphogluconolactonase
MIRFTRRAQGGERLTKRLFAGLFGVASLALVSATPWGGASASASPEGSLVYFGTYTGGGSQGIYVSRLDSTGRLSSPELAASTPNPSFLVSDPSGRYLYSVNEIDEFQGEKAGFATAFAVDRSTGLLKALSQVSTKGTGPCHVSLDKSGRHAFVANYGGGSIAVLPIRDDGSLAPASAFVQHQGHGPNAERQEGPHAHEVLLDPSGRLLWAADLGLDEVLAYGFDAYQGTLTTPATEKAVLPPGAGPRHFAFSQDGRTLFVLSEMALTVTAFHLSGASATIGQTLTILPDGMAPSADFSAAEIELHPSGRFLYASGRGPDSIAVFSVGPEGALKRVHVVPSGGKTPRGFAIDPAGKYLVAGNQGSDEIVVFAIDAATGRLARVGDPVQVVAPVSVAFVPSAVPVGP